MIDMIYNLRVGDIHAAEFSDEFNKLCIPFENLLSEEQIDVFHKILDCVSDTAAYEMRATYKVGFKDGLNLVLEAQNGKNEHQKQKIILRLSISGKQL